MQWKTPPIIKVYEALGAIVDGRLEISTHTAGTDKAKVYSSSGNKYYEVIFDGKNKISSNDNGSYWKGYLGYPSIAFLMERRVLFFDKDIAKYFKNIPWKDINQRFKNNFEESLEYILKGIDDKKRKKIDEYGTHIIEEIMSLKLARLGSKVKPPEGY